MIKTYKGGVGFFCFKYLKLFPRQIRLFSVRIQKKPREFKVLQHLNLEATGKACYNKLI